MDILDHDKNKETVKKLVVDQCRFFEEETTRTVDRINSTMELYFGENQELIKENAELKEKIAALEKKLDDKSE